jgi:hypothetical protein
MTDEQLLARLRKLMTAVESRQFAFAATLKPLVSMLERRTKKVRPPMSIDELIAHARGNAALEKCLRRLAAGDVIEDIVAREVPTGPSTPAGQKQHESRASGRQQILEEFAQADRARQPVVRGKPSDEAGGSWDNAVKVREGD